jgi:SAM-dependent methyltransferase
MNRSNNNNEIIKKLYNYIKKQSELLWSVRSTNETKIDSVSETYGETTEPALTKLINILKNLPIPFTLSKENNSNFLDIGSGFGKVVFHTQLQSNIDRSVGIEFVEKRYNTSRNILKFYSNKINEWNSSIIENPDDDDDNIIRTGNDNSTIEFFQGDVTSSPYSKILSTFSHIYMFDKVFTDSFYDLMIPKFDKLKDLAVLVCYRNFEFLKNKGLTNFSLVGKLKMKTTGKECYLAYIYLRENLIQNNNTLKEDLMKLTSFGLIIEK